MQILNYREQPATSKEMCRFDVYLENVGITLCELRVLRKKTGSGWFIALPCFGKDRPDGGKDWIPYFSFSEARKKEFMDKLHELLKEWVR